MRINNYEWYWRFSGGGGVGSRLITTADWGALTYCHYSLYMLTLGAKQTAAIPGRNLGDIFATNVGGYGEWNANKPSSYETSQGHAICETSKESGGTNYRFLN